MAMKRPAEVVLEDAFHELQVELGHEYSSEPIAKRMATIDQIWQQNQQQLHNRIQGIQCLLKTPNTPLKFTQYNLFTSLEPVLSTRDKINSTKQHPTFSINIKAENNPPLAMDSLDNQLSSREINQAPNEFASPLPNPDEQTIENSSPQLQLPPWYVRLNVTQEDIPEIYHDTNFPINQIASLVRSMQHAIEQSEIPEVRSQEIERLRAQIWKLRYAKMTKDVIKFKKGLELLVEIATTQLFPWDVQSDARMIFKDWVEHYFNGDLMRGIHNWNSIDPEYDNVDWRTAGHNGLENGQWWPRQICCVRDGAHGMSIAGVAPKAVSIVMCMSYSLDEDHGDVIKYSSTIPKDDSNGEFKLTVATKNLLQAEEARTPVRVIRSKPKKRDEVAHKYLPEAGLRYDGLYTIEGHVEMPEDGKSIHVFKLIRLPGQDPIRYKGPEMRPNKEDLVALEKLLQSKNR